MKPSLELNLLDKFLSRTQVRYIEFKQLGEVYYFYCMNMVGSGNHSPVLTEKELDLLMHWIELNYEGGTYQCSDRTGLSEIWTMPAWLCRAAYAELKAHLNPEPSIQNQRDWDFLENRSNLKL